MTDDEPTNEPESPDSGPEESETDGDPFDAFPDRDDPGTDPFEELFGDAGLDGRSPETAWNELRERSGDRAADVTADGNADVHTVPKRSFCENCRFLTPPPEFACTHDGTEIVEFVDRHDVRVKNCPIVRERRELEGTDDGTG